MKNCKYIPVLSSYQKMQEILWMKLMSKLNKATWFVKLIHAIINVCK